MCEFIDFVFQVTMRLVRRMRGSTTVEVAPPRGHFTDIKITPILPLEQINSSPFCKIFEANKQQVNINLIVLFKSCFLFIITQ